MIYESQHFNPDRLAAHLKRARTTIGHGILYELGAGGTDPNAPLPSNSEKRCDCSGFALAWVPGISREQEGKGKPWSESIPWVNTDSVVHDATGEQRLYVQLQWPTPGCMMVYSAAMSGAERCGHCAVVSEVSMSPTGPRSIHGIDCHGGLSGHTISAIEEHDLSYFLAKHAIFVALKEDLHG